jgi:hypothetical protein
MRWGFGWKQARSSCGRTPAGSRSPSGSRKTSPPARRCRRRRCPTWVFEGAVAEKACTRRRLVERRAGEVPAASRRWTSTSASPSPRPCSARRRRERAEVGHDEFKNDEVRVWTLDGDVLIASITAKLHLISPTVTEGLLKASRSPKSQVQGPGDLVAGRDVLRRRQPRGADARLHEDGRQGHRAGREEAAGHDAAPALFDRAGRLGDPRHRARRRLRAGGAIRRRASPRWKATWAWWKWASASCRAAAA